MDEVRSDVEDPTASDFDFLDDGDDIDESEEDHYTLDRALDAVTAGVNNLRGEEVSVAAKKAISKNKEKKSRKVTNAAKQRREGASVKKATTDRGANQRNWSFTIYDCPLFNAVFEMDVTEFAAKASEFIVDKFENAKCSTSYVCVGKEACPETNRSHLQCFVQFATKKRLSCIKKIEKSIHWEVSLGTPTQNRDYCRKDQSAPWVEQKKWKQSVKPVYNPFFSESGELPLSGAQATQVMWAETLELARSGDFLKIAPRILITQVKNLEHIHRRFGTRPTFVNPMLHTGVWIYSKVSGRGKTDCLKAQFPNIYLKAQDTQFNDYTGQEYALIDDFAQESAKMLAGNLKLWTHHQSFQGRILYGTVEVHLRRLFVTSNYSIEDLFENMGPEIFGPIRARFRQFDWDIGDLKWSDRAVDCWSEDNINLCDLGCTQ